VGATSFFMVLMGCASGGSQCEPVTTLPVAYASQASCLTARADVVAATGNLGFATVRAECKADRASLIQAKLTPDI